MRWSERLSNTAILPTTIGPGIPFGGHRFLGQPLLVCQILSSRRALPPQWWPAANSSTSKRSDHRPHWSSHRCWSMQHHLLSSSPRNLTLYRGKLSIPRRGKLKKSVSHALSAPAACPGATTKWFQCWNARVSTYFPAHTQTSRAYASACWLLRCSVLSPFMIPFI